MRPSDKRATSPNDAADLRLATPPDAEEAMQRIKAWEVLRQTSEELLLAGFVHTHGKEGVVQALRKWDEERHDHKTQNLLALLKKLRERQEKGP